MMVGSHESTSVMLLDIADLTETSASQVSFGLSIKFVGYGFASMLIGWLLDHVINRQVAHIVGVAGSAISFFLIPLTPHIYVYYAAQFMNGFMNTIIDVSTFTCSKSECKHANGDNSERQKSCVLRCCNLMQRRYQH
jgi:MFS family permease